MRLTSLTIVAHCYCPPGCDVYRQHLKWEIASLINHPPRIPVDHISIIAEDDGETLRMIYDLKYAASLVANVMLRGVLVPEGKLLRRSIARNDEALRCRSSACWFADADYYFGPGCIDALADQINADTELACPKEVQVNIDHATGDKMVDEARDIVLPKIDPSLFSPLRRKSAIGGLQIVGGNVARECGYLNESKWTKPVSSDKGWRKTTEDVAFRRGRQTTFVSLPNLYWIRHEAKGQDMDAAGNVVGSEAW